MDGFEVGCIDSDIVRIPFGEDEANSEGFDDGNGNDGLKLGPMDGELKHRIYPILVKLYLSLDL